MAPLDATAEPLRCGPDIPFEAGEFDRRLSAVKARMQAAGLDVLLVADPANMNYLCGYDGWSFYVSQLLVVAVEERQPLWVGRACDAVGARFTTYLPAARVVGYPDAYVHAADRHAMDFVGDVLEARGWAARRIGVEMGAFYFTGACRAALERRLPNARLRDATGLVNWVRVVKSPRELAYMREAARIAEHAMAVAAAAIAPGVRQCEAAGAIYQALIAGTPQFGGDYPAIVPILATGAESAAPHLTWNDAPFAAGEGTVVELAGCRHRYHCPLARTVYLGTPPRRVREVAAAMVEGVAAALAAAVPGAVVEEVEAAWSRTIARHGLAKDTRLGYSIGLAYPPDWGERTISIRPGERTVLEPHMAFHLMPGIWLDDCGVEISEPFVVGERAAEPLADFPRRLVVKA